MLFEAAVYLSAMIHHDGGAPVGSYTRHDVRMRIMDSRRTVSHACYCSKGCRPFNGLPLPIILTANANAVFDILIKTLSGLNIVPIR